MNYHHFSDSAFPVLVWVRHNKCKTNYIPISNQPGPTKFNGKSYLANAAEIVNEYKKQKRMMNHERRKQALC